MCVCVRCSNYVVDSSEFALLLFPTLLPFSIFPSIFASRLSPLTSWPSSSLLPTPTACMADGAGELEKESYLTYTLRGESERLLQMVLGELGKESYLTYTLRGESVSGRVGRVMLAGAY